MYNDFKNLNYNQTNHKIQKIRKMVDRLYGDYEFKKKAIEELNKQLKIKINLPSEANLPDLTITNITAIDKGHYFEFTITIKNIGEIATTEETNLVITILDEDIELTIPILDVNETVDRYTSFPYNPDAVDTYSLNVNSEVNEERNIEESDYSNNIKNQDFIIKEKFGTTNLIVHAHNPEGIEINSLAMQWLGNSGSLVLQWTLDEISYCPFPFFESAHNLPRIVSPGTYILKTIDNQCEIHRPIETIVITENECLVKFFTFSRAITEVSLFFEHLGQYYYKFLSETSNGSRFGIQGYTALPFTGSYIDNFTILGFTTPQTLIANTIPYDLNGTGVRG